MKKIKVQFYTKGLHGFACMEHLKYYLSTNPKFIASERKINDNRIEEDTDIVILSTCSWKKMLDIPAGKKVKLCFIPHGLGQEVWTPDLYFYDRVFLPSKFPIIPPDDAENWIIVGWGKTDVLFNPIKEIEEQVKEELSKLPYNKTVLFVPPLGSDERSCKIVDKIVSICEKHKINLIFAQRMEATQWTTKRNLKKPFIIIPTVVNLYYLVKYINLVVNDGNSVGREFYITKKPVIDYTMGALTEAYKITVENIESKVLEALEYPEHFVHPDDDAKKFIHKFDGKVTQRIMTELEKVYSEPSPWSSASRVNYWTLKRHVVGYAFVVGDLLHFGHLRFLRQCKKYCHYLIVGVYTDELTSTYKRKPIIPFKQRVELIKELRIVDEIRKVTDKDCTPMLKQLVNEGYNILMLFHGDDWKTVKGKEYIESIGGRLILLPYTKGISTTSIINKIEREYIDKRNTQKVSS